jgi:hypothetical protein
MKASAALRIAGRQHDVEALWYDLGRWSSFVDGFGHVDRVEGEWPAVGARVIWDSPPHGRGRVIEKVTAWQAGDGQDVEVEDERLLGTQRVRFTSEGDLTGVSLELSYELKNRHVGHQVVDAIFIRPQLRRSLERTLRRLAIEVAADRELRA